MYVMLDFEGDKKKQVSQRYGTRRDARTHQLIIFRSPGLPSSFKRSPLLLKGQNFDPFVSHELQGPVADADQGQESPAIETSQSLRLVDA